MKSRPARNSPLWLCVWAALIALFVTVIVPILFFQFPGPRFVPLSYEFMWAVTEFLWKPLRILQINLTPLFASDLRQHVNPYFVAPLVNGPAAFVATFGFLMLWSKWQTKSHDGPVQPGLHSVIDHVEEIRADYPAALHKLPHPSTHADELMRDARTQIATHPYFQGRADPEVPREDEHAE